MAGVAGTMAFAGPASAAPAARAAYNGACGQGYAVVDSADIDALGTVYLTWNDQSGRNCVVTVRAAVGPAVMMAAELYQTENPGVSAGDAGMYTTYAGPISIPARGACVTWGGSIDEVVVEYEGHCGSLR